MAEVEVPGCYSQLNIHFLFLVQVVISQVVISWCPRMEPYVLGIPTQLKVSPLLPLPYSHALTHSLSLKQQQKKKY